MSNPTEIGSGYVSDITLCFRTLLGLCLIGPYKYKKWLCFCNDVIFLRPLQRMGVGMFLAVVAFLIAAGLQIEIDVSNYETQL